MFQSLKGLSGLPRSAKPEVAPVGLSASVADATRVIVYDPGNLAWDLRAAFAENGSQVTFARDNDQIVGELKNELRAGDHVVIMSNGSFNGLQHQLLEQLGQT